ncbi:hypothetical protein DCAR_0104737 [Daucus carota subsp. sativus]|uniref:Protein BIG GRAIN 1-like B n=1 Tax=Daucus carota subsp. sativus TaxID=79200 RepID=A0AAF1AMG4_DAUCS|nr:PREDICTED: protein BIG GRAIN 1-like B [Daucus carota subsp. sativus]WOG85546.1 hypothetical protein DCAR_0104737 [Daucus carota subsp. sativus]
MYAWERTEKVRKNPKSPSFSSSLLDEIYREIDGSDDSYKGFEQQKEKNVKNLHCSKNYVNGGGDRAKASGRTVEDEEMTSLRRACLIEKWMEKKVNDKVSARKGSLVPEFDEKYLIQDNDPLFFSSSSCSSDSSFGGFSSSETESFGVGNWKSSSLPAPKPIRTNVQKHDQFYLFDDYRNHQTNKTKDGLIKSKTRAVKIYENLKKMKQPISPGGRLTGFINSLFTHGDPKKTKNSHQNHNEAYDLNAVYDLSSHRTRNSSKCSSASSFSRSCLSKDSARSKERLNNGIKRTVSFFPVSVIVDEHSRPCGNKYFEKGGEKSQRNQNANDFVSTKYCKENDADADDDYEDDAASDSSSDLFELDHLSLFKTDTFCDDLPVYETTYMEKNRAIAGKFIK